MEWTPILIVLSTVISLGFTVLWTRNASLRSRQTLDSLGNQLKQGLEDINTQLEPIIQANSRAMGVISHMADDGKMEKALERRIGQDLIGQNDDILEMIKMAFPNVAEYLDSHPEAITKLMPRLNTLISDPETRKRLNLQGLGKSSDVSRIWNEERD